MSRPCLHFYLKSTEIIPYLTSKKVVSLSGFGTPQNGQRLSDLQIGYDLSD